MSVVASVLFESRKKRRPRRKKGMLQRAKETARMALGQDDGDDYECAHG